MRSSIAAASAVEKQRSSIGGDVGDVDGADVADAPAEVNVVDDDVDDAVGDGKVEDDANI